MKNKKTIILTASDFSKCAKNALDYAIKSYKDYNAKIVLIHALSEGYVENNIEILVDKDPKITKNNIERKLESILLNKMKKNNLTCDYEVITEFGLPLEIILKTIQKVKPFFIIMGAKKTTSFIENLFKNDTINVIEQATCPVII